MVFFPSEAEDPSADLPVVGVINWYEESGEIDHEWRWNDVVSWR
jgi:hypothetical protein